MADLESVRAHQADRKVPTRLRVMEPLQQRRAKGMKMSELVADPRWEEYGRELEAAKAQAEAHIAVCQNNLLDTQNPLEPKEELKNKLALAHNRGALEALKMALSVAQDLITDGEKAAEEMGKLEGGEKT